MRPLILLAVFLLSACSSAPKPTILAAKCEDTPVKAADLEPLNFQPAPGKVVVVRLMRINCPFCKEDLRRIGSFFQNGTWNKDKVHLFLIAYRKEGIEDRKTFDKFMREELPGFGIPMEAAQAIYLDKDYYALVRTRNKTDALIFEEWRAVPFGLVFGTDGRLAYRGHFTTSSGAENTHYDFITQLQAENCPTPK
ncbi:MAG: hypothetical protein KF799_04615 [Bdellovibrionales bacterium]|nr:hypothetical protein [Bdellovibrionales bacterium]